MTYEQIMAVVIAIEASDREYYDFDNADDLLKEYGYVPDEAATLIFDEACKHGGVVLHPMLRQLELRHLGVNCDGPDYWLTKLEQKYGDSHEV